MYDLVTMGKESKITLSYVNLWSFEPSRKSDFSLTLCVPELLNNKLLLGTIRVKLPFYAPLKIYIFWVPELDFGFKWPLPFF